MGDDREPPLTIGQIFVDKYEIQALIGQGGQAWVYRAVHRLTQREAAIKILKGDVLRGEGEARSLGQIINDNVVEIWDAGSTSSGQLYLVMELLRGVPLSGALKRCGRLHYLETLEIALQVASAVAAAHAKDIIHRDIKPDNIFLTKDHRDTKPETLILTRGTRVKVLDFGIATLLAKPSLLTGEAKAVGTMAYMAAEQLLGAKASPRSDICSLGLVMFELIVGQRFSDLMFARHCIEHSLPLSTPITLAHLMKIMTEVPAPMLSELDPGVPLYVAKLIQRMIAKRPQERFDTMLQVAVAIESCLKRGREELASKRQVPIARELWALGTDDDFENTSAVRNGSAMDTERNIAFASEAAPVVTDIEHARTVPMGTVAGQHPPSAPIPVPKTEPINPVRVPVQHAVSVRHAEPIRSPSRAVERESITSREPNQAEATREPPRATNVAAKTTIRAIPRRSQDFVARPVTPPPVAVQLRDSQRVRSHATAPRHSPLQRVLTAGSLLGVLIGGTGALLYFYAPQKSSETASSHVGSATEEVSSAQPPSAAAAPPASAGTPKRDGLDVAGVHIEPPATAPEPPKPAAPAKLPTPVRASATSALPARKAVGPTNRGDKMEERLRELEKDFGKEQKAPASTSATRSWL